MLRTDKPIYKIILVLNLLLIIAAIAFTVIGITSDGATLTRNIALTIKLLALLFAGFYIILGYEKDAAKYLKLFGILYLFSIIFETYSCIVNTCHTMDLILDAFIITCLLCLVFVKDQGKTKSFVICAILVALHIACVILVYLEGDPTVVKINLFMGVDLACLYGIMTYAKYLDKAERGTK